MLLEGLAVPRPPAVCHVIAQTIEAAASWVKEGALKGKHSLTILSITWLVVGPEELNGRSKSAGASNAFYV